MKSSILIIEDNLDNMNLLRYLLTKFGYEVLSALNGNEGIQLAIEHTPDLILCDIELPDLTGYEIAKIIKENKNLKEIPMVAVTAFSKEADKNKIRESGFDLYISKPINPSNFIKEIENILAKSTPLSKPTRIVPPPALEGKQ